MEFCDLVMEFYQFCPQFVLNYIFLVTTKKLSGDLESPHFLTFSEKGSEIRIGETDGHGKSRNGHGKVMEKYFLKSGNPNNGRNKSQLAISCMSSNTNCVDIYIYSSYLYLDLNISNVILFLKERSIV